MPRHASPAIARCRQLLLHRVHVLVAAARQVHQHDRRTVRARARASARSAIACADSSAGRMPSRRASVWNAVERLVVRDVRVLGPADAPAATRAPGRPPRSRARPRSSASARCCRPRPAARRSACPAARRRCRRRTARRGGRARCASPPASTPISRTSAIVDERVEDADRVAAAADAGHDGVGQPAGQLEDLRARLAADHRLELAHHQRIRMRAEHRPEQVVRVADVGDPVAHRLVDGVLQRAAAGVDADRPRRRAGACGRRSAPAAPCPRRPCRRGTRGRAARTPSPSRRRAGRRRSRRRCAACPCAPRAAPARARC